MTEPARYRLDDLRRFAAALSVGVGVTPARALALATHLLWFDAAGAAPFGIETLPAWLERIEARHVDPGVEGKVRTEMTGTAVLDGQNGLPPLILARAGGLAIEKARDAGVGVVRVVHLGPAGPAASVTAEMAIGPFAGLALGPGPDWAVALPSEDGLPAVFDSALGAPEPKGTARRGKASPLGGFALWAAALAPEGGWLVAAIAVAALEPLATFHERVGDVLQGQVETPGQLLPHTWGSRRREAREHGVAVAAPTWNVLKSWAERLKVDIPEPTLSPPRESPRKQGEAGA